MGGNDRFRMVTGPVSNTLHRVLGNTLSVAAPLHSNGARTTYIRDNDGQSDITPRTVALNPSILGEDKSIQAFIKVLNHVVALGLAVHKEIKTNFLLESNNGLNFFGDELIVLTTGELTLAEFDTGLTDLLGLRERPNCSSWELGQTQVLLLRELH